MFLFISNDRVYLAKFRICIFLFLYEKHRALGICFSFSIEPIYYEYSNFRLKFYNTAKKDSRRLL